MVHSGGDREQALEAVADDMSGMFVMNNSIDPRALVEGEFVVHKNSGVCKFLGIKRMAAKGTGEEDYIILKYGDGLAKLRISSAQRLLYRYRTPGEGGKDPKLNSLSDARAWQRRKARGRMAIQSLVNNLMDVYLERVMITRPPYPEVPQDAGQRLEDGFPYDLTPDQVTAIADVYEDMSRDTPTDRLIIGDVGFGKTEVAVRAIFRAVCARKQVLLLCPTTVLARQHAILLTQRLAPFGIEVGFLTRFTSGPDRERIAAGMADGSMLVVVGTHALLADAPSCANLGMLVIDEEQRFGVKHKEAITGLKTTVDVVTMSATPIPRTLHMALAGFRDASLIATPPEGRRPIQTDLIPYSDLVVSEAISKEIARGGQVFYVVPRVQMMEGRLEQLLSLIPGLRIQMAHGQMKASELEEAMEAFSEGQFDVLLCTTIVESGLDMPRVNTILVEDVQLFGLASLYQLRGRVGRNNLQAYAVLLYEPSSTGSPEVSERLHAIRDCCGLGEGFKLAERDMAIRGVGSVFGEKQSGDAAQVGVDLYLEMLYEQLSGVESLRLPQVTMDAVHIQLPNLRAFVPATHTPSEEAQQRLAEKIVATGREGPTAVKTLKDSLEDKWGGPLPDPLYRLLRLQVLRWYAAEMGIHKVELGPVGCIYLYTAMGPDAYGLLDTVMPDVERNTLRWDHTRILLTQNVSTMDIPLWEVQPEMHCERVIHYLALLHSNVPRFLKYM